MKKLSQSKSTKPSVIFQPILLALYMGDFIISSNISNISGSNLLRKTQSYVLEMQNLT